jgi:cytochrome oxidase assembly protein ShyY1
MTEQNRALPWYRLAFTRRWLSYLLLTVIFAGACVGLGMWQFARRDEAQREIARVLTNFDSAPVSLATAIPDDATFDDSHKWQPVTVTGTYLVEKQLLVRSRPHQQEAGYEVLTPLLLNDGRIFVIDRGWLPAQSTQDALPRIPVPPAGTVTVVARVKAGEPSIAGRGISNGQLATIELPLIAAQLSQPTITGGYGLLSSETPAATEKPPLAALRPEVDEGPHLSYALQWMLFAAMGFFGLGWAIRNELKIKNAEQPKEQAKAARRQAKRQVQPTEEDIEDALLDAHRS